MNTILLYYKYIFIEHPQQLLKWQRKLATDLNLTGRIIIAHEGINGTVEGSDQNIARYQEIMRKHPLFTDLEFKQSKSPGAAFPKMRIVVKKEIVNLGIDPEKLSAQQGGIHLTPEQTHELIARNATALVIFDARNKVESDIGAFKNAVIPNIEYFRELPAYIDQHLDTFKDKEVLMYCTGGVRCERASAYLKNKGVAKNVYQIKGGIHTYTEQYPDGYFRGKNYVFDGRISMKINDDVLGSCALCSVPCDDYTNCLNASCNNHFICCAACLDNLNNTCSQACLDLLNSKQVAPRPARLQPTIADAP